MKYVFTLLVLVTLGFAYIGHRHVEEQKDLALGYAILFCSCNGNLRSITYGRQNFSFECNDGSSYGKFIPYETEYWGKICK